jgi:predicted phage terminase large subunit-like protein
MALNPKDQFSLLPRHQQQSFIDGLSEHEAQALLESWEHWLARPEQLPPEGDWFIWLFLAGRGTGKTRAAAEFIVGEIQTGNAKRVALVGRTAGDVRDVMVTGQSGILAVARRRGLIAKHEPSKRLITFDNGAVCTTYSADAGDSLRGPEHDLAWGDEIASWPQNKSDDDAWANLLFGLRIGERPRLIATTTPRPSKFIINLTHDPRVAVTKSTTYDNASNLSKNFLAEIEARYKGTRLGRQELMGELLEQIEGAFWSSELIDASRSLGAPALLKRIVLSIDPATTVSKNSDFTAVTVSGLGEDDNFYVLHSEQMKATPNEWASRAIELFNQWDCDLVIAEVNQGGLMVEHTLRSIDKNLPLKLIHAKRGKTLRAEPVVALYEQGRVKHTRVLDELEDQMASFPVATDNDDLVDSLVYSITELAALDSKPKPQLYIFP